MKFEQLGLISEIQRAVREQGYEIPTPIQAQAIPLVLEGHDIMAAAQTGTGKTAGFTLPVLDRLHRHATGARRPFVRALVLTPTRELAAQVAESVATYGKHLPLKSAVVFGGVGIHPQIRKLARGVDILIATPGRLLDLASQGAVDLGRVEVLVLDEADRMLDMGFIHDIRRVIRLLPKQRQNLMFSATFSKQIKQLASTILRDPVLVEVARNQASTQVKQVVHQIEKGQKRALLSHMIRKGDWRQVLVFTRTKHGANRLAEQLGRDGITSTVIHGNKSQTARTRALADFKKGEVRVLVATDIAARGLDIQQLPHVVNYELPHVPEDYVHRIGRTGRAGSKGCAASLVSADERKLLAGIERLTGKRVPVVEIEDFVPAASSSDAQMHRNRNGRPSRGRTAGASHPARQRSNTSRRRFR